MPFLASIQLALQQLEADGLLRHPRRVTGPQGPTVTLDGSPVLSLCSNNYLGLADHPKILEASAAALRQAGYGSAASRHISGTADLHLQTEAAFAEFVGLPASTLFSSGYSANLGTVQALCTREDHIFSDQLNHASLIDGCRLSHAQVHVFPHRDYHRLEQLLRSRPTGGHALVLTDALFSMDGDRADLAHLRSLCDQYQAGLMVDEAHSLGILGPQGRGLCAAEGVSPDVLVGTLGKAFGCAGAFVAAQQPTVSLIRNRARSWIFSTAPPPSQAAAALAALTLVKEADAARSHLFHNAKRLSDGLTALGLKVSRHTEPTPILPILVGDPTATMAASAALLKEGVFVHGIRPPTVAPGTSRLRVTAMATHTDSHIDHALRAFQLVSSLIP